MPRTNTPQRWVLAASLLCLATSPLAAGCGETKTASQAAATTTPPTTTPAATTPAATTSGPTTKPASTGASTTSHPSAIAKARVRQAFSSLANAKPAPKLPASQRANLAVDDIELTSPTIHGTPATIARENTCDGADRTPALNWKNIPPGTAELAIFIISTTPVNNKLFYDWIITGINPHSHGIPAGQTPPEATPIQNSTGHTNYTICPPNNKNETYLIALYALPHKLTTTPGTEPNELHKQALHTAHHSGLLVGSYQKP